jgi:hypothetical protein
MLEQIDLLWFIQFQKAEIYTYLLKSSILTLVEWTILS